MSNVLYTPQRRQFASAKLPHRIRAHERSPIAAGILVLVGLLIFVTIQYPGDAFETAEWMPLLVSSVLAGILVLTTYHKPALGLSVLVALAPALRGLAPKGVFGYNFLTYAALLVCLVLVVRRPRRLRPDVRFDRAARYALLAFMAVLLLQAFRTQFPVRAALTVVNTVLMYAALHVVGPRLQVRELMAVLKAFMAGVLTFSTWVLLFSEAGSEDAIRLGADLGLNPNSLALLNTMSVIITIVLLLHRKISPIWLAGILPALITLVLSGSRTGSISLGLGLMFALLWSMRRPAKLVLFASILALTVGYLGSRIISLEDSSLLRRYENLVSLDLDRISTTRSMVWSIAGDLLWKKPMIGIGLANLPIHTVGIKLDRDRGLTAHSLYLEVAAELGFTGLVPLLFWIAMWAVGFVTDTKHLAAGAVLLTFLLFAISSGYLLSFVPGVLIAGVGGIFSKEQDRRQRLVVLQEELRTPMTAPC